MQQLIDSLKTSSIWADLSIQDLVSMIESSTKKRHEIVDNKIRALYGHTLPQKIVKQEGIPPAILYHGTIRDNIPHIQKSGLQPMNRQYVHLSEDTGTAISVGKRKGKEVIVLFIDTTSAINRGVKFYLGNEKVWLADNIPSEFIKPLS